MTQPDESQRSAAEAPEATSQISGGHLVARALKNEGVDTIFTLCGGHIIDIYDGCIDEGIKIIDVRHEQVAAHAADGYGRMTGQLGCAVVTAGPGTTNSMTGVANAFRAESAMLLIGGQAAIGQHRMGGLQDLPHVEMLRPITKFASSVMSTERVADFVTMAARESRSGAFGPSYLEIPRDILDKKIDKIPPSYRRRTPIALWQEPRRPERHRPVGRHPPRGEPPLRALRSTGLDLSRHRQRSHLLRDFEHSDLHERRRQGNASARPPAQLPAHPAGRLRRG
jgi:hypothetical protein